MAQPIELVIFDCDGVLVDSERIAVRVDALVLAELGWNLTEAEIVDRFMGLSSRSMTRQIEDHLGRRLPADWEEEFKPLYDDALAAELTPVEGIVDALDALTHLPTCVASSGSHDKMRLTLGTTGLRPRFEGRCPARPRLRPASSGWCPGPRRPVGSRRRRPTSWRRRSFRHGSRPWL
ncbi:HAD hydrolase-like protein [Streptomyces sp. JL1001]|uniref:HAD hydrolase-like protein n=1 Tax=Streptomyces sp. JL1001 TaxID=3078227 RepID=A0AAU8KCR2_9ACTN|nr:HAD hydrolase-like protein [Streptomyces sp. Termitarium-T10T-6]